MPVEIVPMSPQASELAKIGPKRETKYPFSKLEPGQSFTVPIAEANTSSLRVLCDRKSKDGKVFKMIVHDTPAVVEVARLA